MFDGNLNTFFDGPDASGDWVGLDFGAGVNYVVGQINYWPRTDWSERMLGGIFQGANNASFTNAVTLFTIATAPPEGGTVTSQTMTNSQAFRFVRYVGPANGYCNVAELQFFSVNPVPSPTGLRAIATNGAVILSWTASSGATSYNVKRSTTSGEETTIANVTGTTYTDTAVVNGTTYYYAVSAVNGGGSSGNSPEVSATPTAPSSPYITRLDLSGTMLNLSATNGSAGGTYLLLMTTNITMPLNQWTPVLTNIFDAGGNLNLSTNIVRPGDAQKFYILQSAQ